MLQLLPVLIPIALVDAASLTPLALVPLMTLMAGPRPYRNVAALFVGLYISYFAMGLGFVFGMGRVFDRLNAWVAHRWHHPEPVDFGLELALGLVLLLAAAPLRAEPPAAVHVVTEAGVVAIEFTG